MDGLDSVYILVVDLQFLGSQLKSPKKLDLGFIIDCIFLFVWCCAQQVPGATGNFVFIKDAVYEKPDISLLPFPTYFVSEDEDIDNLKPLVAELGDVDPFMVTD